MSAYGLWILWHRHSCLCCRDTTSIMRTAFQPCRKMPSIPLSSLSEPAGARPEFARVGEPRASRKDDSGDIFYADSMRSHFEPDHTNYFVPTHYFDRTSALRTQPSEALLKLLKTLCIR